jgi:sugar phosphate isomerase/epimerase
MKISNYSLSYDKLFQQGQMDVFKFLALSCALGVEGASLHVRQLESTTPEYLKRVHRAYLDHDLSISLFTVSTDFGRPADQHEAEFAKAREAARVGMFLGAPLLRIFAGAPPAETDRAPAFARATASVRKLCAEAAQAGMMIGLQDHNHGALVRTGDEVLRFFKKVDHPNLTFVLDTGQFAGSRGASAKPAGELRDADFLASIRQTASLARHVRVKFYNPRPDGSEPFIDYGRMLNILGSVHYAGFLDIVYEGGVGTDGPGEDPRVALSRVVKFLASQTGCRGGTAGARPAWRGPRYKGLVNDPYFLDKEVRTETSVAFLEGPAVDRSGVVYFTSGPTDEILRWDPKTRQRSVFRDKANEANGLRIDRQGRGRSGGGQAWLRRFVR